MGRKEDIENGIVESVGEFCDINLSSSSEIDSNYGRNEGEDLRSSINFYGDIDGNIDVWISPKNASILLGKMMGIDVEENSEDIVDGLGEINNIIAGGFKTKLSQNGCNFDIGVPSDKRDNALEIAYRDKLNDLKLRFNCENATFIIDVEYVVVEKDKKEDKKPEEKKLSAADMLSQLLGAAASTPPEASTPSEDSAPKEVVEAKEDVDVEDKPDKKENDGNILSSKKVLVVHESENNRNAIVGILNKEKVNDVFVAQTENESLEIANSNNPDIVILDYFLNKERGLEVCKKIKEGDQNKKVVLLIYRRNLFIETKVNECKIDKVYSDDKGYDGLVQSLKEII